MTNRHFHLALLLSITSPAAWAQDPVGGEFQVNSYTTGVQSGAAVASDATGRFVVVWSSENQDGSGFGVFGRRFNDSGVPQGSEFRVNSYTTGVQLSEAVASDANGNFVVVWSSNGQDGSSYGVFGQRFNAAGVPQGGEFRVNSYTTGGQSRSAVAVAASGDFVVVWSGIQIQGLFHDIFGQRFNAAGVPQGSEFRVNSYTVDSQTRPSVASDANGNFVVVWESFMQDWDGWGVFGQRFNAAGVPQGGEFRVNSYTPLNEYRSSVASATNGDFVVVWHSNQLDGSWYGVFGQRFNASGVPQGSEFRVNTYTTGIQSAPSVASDANGNFVVVWQSGQDGSGYSVFGQRFNASGIPQGSEFRVNSYTTLHQFEPNVASASNGAFVVAWTSGWSIYGQDGSSLGVFGQRYGDLLFKDGFE